MGKPRLTNKVHTKEMNKLEMGIPSSTYHNDEKISKQSKMGEPKERDEIEIEEGEITEQNYNEEKYLFQENMVVDVINWELDSLDDKQSMTSTINQFTENFGIAQKNKQSPQKEKSKVQISTKSFTIEEHADN